jgi:hypothetical protein
MAHRLLHDPANRKAAPDYLVIVGLSITAPPTSDFGLSSILACGQALVLNRVRPNDRSINAWANFSCWIAEQIDIEQR